MSAGWTDAVSAMQNGVKAINNLSVILEAAFPRITGSFTLIAGVTTTIIESGTQADSIVVVSPSNAAAASVVSGGYWIDNYMAGASFDFNAVGGAGGTETFSYIMVNPS